MKKNVVSLGPADAKWIDHHYMNHWLWACHQDAFDYLKASHANMQAPTRKLAAECDRRSYHFITTMGTMLRVLERSVVLFPAIKPAYDQATQLLTEGKNLRDMIEHAYGGLHNYHDGNGKFQEEFIWKGEGFEGSATGAHITPYGHFLGSRLCVEDVMLEIQTIINAANAVPPPD